MNGANYLINGRFGGVKINQEPEIEETKDRILAKTRKSEY
jgi:hypothetical protein